MHRVRALYLLSLVLLAATGRPASALPLFARQYSVKCVTCHTTPPHLNRFGRTFLANNFQWPGGKKAKSTVPLSLTADFSYRKNVSGGGPGSMRESGGFRNLFLLSGGTFPIEGERRGSYFIRVLATRAHSEAAAGSLGQAYLMAPVSGGGRFTVGIGNTSPVMYQWNVANSLSENRPLALMRTVGTAPLPGGAVNGGGGGGYDYKRGVGAFTHLAAGGSDGSQPFSLMMPGPSVRLDYFSNRGQGTDEGLYASVVVPFEGKLILNDGTHIGGSNGVFFNVWTRQGDWSAGPFIWTEAGHSLSGLIATYDVTSQIYLLGIFGVAKDETGSGRRLSVEADWIPHPQLGLFARFDHAAGQRAADGIDAGISFYPEPNHILRFFLEANRVRGQRAWLAGARVQY